MAFKGIRLVPAFLVLSAVLSCLATPGSASDFQQSYPKAISDLKEGIVKGLGFQADEFKISGFDVRDALVGHSVAYELDIEIDNRVLPFKLLEDVHRWEYVDLPIFQVEDPVWAGKENLLVEKQKFDEALPMLAPFQLAGPMELWIQDAKDMRLSLPFGFHIWPQLEPAQDSSETSVLHDVDAGVLKKVILADGAVVTVKGARSVSLRRPIDLPLPLNRTSDGFASGILNLAEQLRHFARSQTTPILSLRIVGPTSLTSPSAPSSPNNRLKLKRLAPGLVELSSPSSSKALEPLSDVSPSDEATALLTPKHFTTMWPLTSVNGSNQNLVGFEALLASVLGPKAHEEGSFKLLKADVSAQTSVKIGFGVEKKLKAAEVEGIPAWRTKPESVRMHFEVLAKVDGDKVVPERVTQVNPVMIEDTVAPNVLMNNVTMSKVPIVHQPSSPFTL
ncbi:hypothetical protein CDL15_Pgr008255 [Punica granatum]|uniref:Uncharacterized protein n=1 Tax=Punica granatum TaxID=22663 RepID=A0A218VUY7_PUNGR|nr:hypothetical protein CDL15_Pgr008255 [Punica granatum]